MTSIENNVERDFLSLFHNMWLNRQNPLFELNMKILQLKERGNYWIHRIEEILKKYHLPKAVDLMMIEAPNKGKWKSIIKKSINSYQENKWIIHITNKQSTPYIYP